MKKVFYASSLVFLLFIWAGCEPVPETVTATLTPEAATFTPTAVAAEVVILPTATELVNTPTPSPTLLASPTAEPTAEPTRSPTATVTPLTVPFDITIAVTPVLATQGGYWTSAAGAILVWGNPKQARIYDVSIPFEPKEVALIEEAPIFEPVIAGENVYLAAGNLIQVWNLLQPDHPAMVENAGLQGRPLYVTADQQLYLLGTGESGQLVIRVLDMANPAEPQELVAADWSLSRPHQIQVIDGLLYALYDNYMAVIDITSGPAAVEVTTISLPTNIVSEIEVVANRAYVLADSAVWVFDASNPAAPEQIAHYQSSWNAIHLDVVDYRVFLTWQICDGHVNDDETVSSSCGQGVEVVDFTDPERPFYLGVIRIRMPSGYLDETFFTAEAGYFIISAGIYGLDFKRQLPALSQMVLEGDS